MCLIPEDLTSERGQLLAHRKQVHGMFVAQNGCTCHTEIGERTVLQQFSGCKRGADIGHERIEPRPRRIAGGLAPCTSMKTLYIHLRSSCTCSGSKAG